MKIDDLSNPCNAVPSDVKPGFQYPSVSGRPLFVGNFIEYDYHPGRDGIWVEKINEKNHVPDGT